MLVTKILTAEIVKVAAVIFFLLSSLHPSPLLVHLLQDLFISAVVVFLHDTFCRAAILGGPYWENVLGHWKESLENPHKVMFLKYEDLKQSPGEVIRGVARFLGFPFSPDEESKGVVDDIIKLRSFEKLQSLEVNGPNKKVSTLGADMSAFFRRGEVGDWANYLTPEMIARIDSITDEKFQGSGLKCLNLPMC